MTQLALLLKTYFMTPIIAWTVGRVGRDCALLLLLTTPLKGSATSYFVNESGLQVLAGLGMTPIAPAMTPPQPPTYITVMLDGKLVGHVRSINAPALVTRLRDIKAAKLAEEESLPAGASTIMLDVSTGHHVCLAA